MVEIGPPQPVSNGFPQLEHGRVLNKSCPRNQFSGRSEVSPRIGRFRFARRFAAMPLISVEIRGPGFRALTKRRRGCQSAAVAFGSSRDL